MKNIITARIIQQNGLLQMAQSGGPVADHSTEWAIANGSIRRTCGRPFNRMGYCKWVYQEDLWQTMKTLYRCDSSSSSLKFTTFRLWGENTHHDKTAVFGVNMRRTFFFTVVPCILILSKLYYQLMHKKIALKGVLKFTLKQLQHVSV